MEFCDGGTEVLLNLRDIFVGSYYPLLVFRICSITFQNCGRFLRSLSRLLIVQFLSDIVLTRVITHEICESTVEKAYVKN